MASTKRYDTLASVSRIALATILSFAMATSVPLNAYATEAGMANEPTLELVDEPDVAPADDYSSVPESVEPAQTDEPAQANEPVEQPAPVDQPEPAAPVAPVDVQEVPADSTPVAEQESTPADEVSLEVDPATSIEAEPVVDEVKADEASDDEGQKASDKEDQRTSDDEQAKLEAQASSYSDSKALSGSVLDGVTIRLRPGGMASSIAINNDGFVTKNVAHLWNTGRSARLLLQKADDNSYYIHFFHYAWDTEPSKAVGARVFDVDSDWTLLGGNDYSREGAAIHVTDDGDDMNKRWQVVPSSNGMYRFMNRKSGKYMKLEDSNGNKKWDDGDKLVQTSKEPWDFEMEIVNSGKKDSTSAQSYSSYTFEYAGKKVASCNWMSALPNDTPLTDLNIPGVHDAATNSFLLSGSTGLPNVGDRLIDTAQADTAQCQQLYFDDLITAGVRYFDLRCNVNMLDGGTWSPALNHTFYCADRDGSFLTMNDVWNYTRAAWNGASKGETFIWQISEQDLGDMIVDPNVIFDYLKDLVEANPDKFYIGDHVPTLKEVRGKILILSKLSPWKFTFGRNYDYDKNGVKGKWALDISTDIDQSVYENAGDTVKIADGTNYEVWVEDDYKTNADTKWSRSISPSLSKAAGHRDTAIGKGKYAWNLIFTSASAMANEGTTPIAAARNINPRLKSYFDANMKNYFDASTKKGKYAGVVLSDFVDQQLCQYVYRQNFMMDMPKVATQQHEGTINPETPDTPDTPANPVVEVSVNSNRNDITVNQDSMKLFAISLATPEELVEIASGATLKVWLDVQVVDSADQVPADDVELLTQRAEELGCKIGSYALVTLYKQVGDNPAQTIEELPEHTLLPAKWSIPQSMRQTGRRYGVISVHDGKVIDNVSLTLNQEVSFYFSRFSTFALMHKDSTSITATRATTASRVPTTSSSKSLANTGDVDTSALIAILALGGVACLYVAKRFIRE